MKPFDIAISMLLCLVIGMLVGHYQRNEWKNIEIRALEKQIAKQNCDEMTWPKLKKSVGK